MEVIEQMCVAHVPLTQLVMGHHHITVLIALEHRLGVGYLADQRDLHGLNYGLGVCDCFVWVFLVAPVKLDFGIVAKHWRFCVCVLNVYYELGLWNLELFSG